MIVDMLGPETEAAEFIFSLIRGSPEKWAFSARGSADRIDDDKRADAKAARGHRARGAQSTF